MAIKDENDEFFFHDLKHVSGLTVILNHLGRQNYEQKLMKMAIKRKNDEFFVITLKHVNHLGTLKLWEIAHENCYKTRKLRVFGHSLKHVSGLTIILNRTGNPILWAINHENIHKTQK